MKLRYLVVLLVILSFISLFVGVSDIRPWDLFRLTEDQADVMMISRIPRLVSILIAGAGMSIIGLIMQQLTRNKFVSPTTAGTTDSASFGVLISMVVFPGSAPLVKIIVAFVFAMAGTLLMMRIMERLRYRDPVLVALVGLMFGSIVGSATTFLALKYDLIQSVSSWMNGSFSTILKGRYEMLYVSIPMIVLAYLFADRFTIAGMGESFSVNLGLNYRQVMRIGIVIVALVSSVILLTVGSLPFLGLIIPNLVSLYKGDNLRSSLGHTAALGAVFVLACDIMGRIVIYPFEVPIGLVVGVLGSGIFLFLLLRRRAAHE
ncbi:ABC transporter permease [Cohnella thailandensis]|uniref:ABC transporter permease n=1 Tax=Cohnella thailandensis TaxID=557557 RepID=A0A841T4I5_9BACL|nr:ABC transporter permease [Cohnella thailandensis]MBB6636041.1 ABC transporter permease [Cohnella thailandensis]MBP1976804.1 iron complex transport system permease protein [Cohnella thailandensis]